MTRDDQFSDGGDAPSSPDAAGCKEPSCKEPTPKGAGSVSASDARAVPVRRAKRDERFLPAYRVRRAADFRRAYERRRSSGDGVLLVFACENDLEYPRLGLSVSRKVGGAVARNRWKRLLREAFRLSRLQLPVGVDLIAIPRASAPPPLDALRSALERLALQAAGKLRRGVRPRPSNP